MDEVAEIKSRLEITEVVGAYLPLKQAGRNLKAPCPFHQEKTASFMVSPDKGIYHCFGCGEGGDIFSFVEKMEGLDFRGTLELLARKAGVELKAKKGENREAARLRERLIEAQALAVRYFQVNLLGNKKALEYVVKTRGLRRETIRDFQIGYAPESWDGLTGALQGKGFNAKEILQGGLAGQKSDKNRIYDLFRGRVMFTICDREGRPIGFTGRVLDDSLPKYLNTPQTPIYDKSSAIFGFHLAKDSIRENKEVVLVEGNMDVIASHQAGIKQVVAASGTALTVQQIKQLNGLTKKLILAFDSDKAGMEATRRVVPLASERAMEVYALSLTDGKDADEVIKKDANLWKDAIRGAKEIRDYWLDKSLSDFDLSTNLGAKQFTDRMIEIAKLFNIQTDHKELRAYSDSEADIANVNQELFLARVAEKSKIDINVLRNALKNLEKSGSKQRRDVSINSRVNDQSQSVRRAVVQTNGRPSSKTVLEESLLSLVILDENTRISLSDLDEEVFSTDQRKRVFHMVKFGNSTLKPLTEDEDYVKILLLRGEQEFTDLAPADRSIEAFGLARRLQMVSNKLNKQRLSEQLREAEKSGDAQLVSTILKQYQALLEEEV